MPRVNNPAVVHLNVRSLFPVAISLTFALFLDLSAGAQQPSASSPELVLQTGHSQGVNTVAFSHDQRWLASASSDHTVKLWDLSSGFEVRTFSGHSDGVKAVAFSPDGRLLASGGDDNNVKLWESASGRELFTMPTGDHPMGIMKVAFDSTGQKLISLNQDRTVIVWDTATGQELRRFSAGGMSGVAFGTDLTPDGRYVVSDFRDSTINRGLVGVWDVTTGQMVVSHLINLYISHPHISSDAAWMLASDDHLGFYLWDLGKGTPVFQVPGNPDIGSSFGDGIALSPDKRLIAVGDFQNHVLRLVDASTGNPVRNIQNASLESLRFSDDGRLLAAADGSDIDVLDVGTGHVLHTLRGYARNIGALSLSADGHYLSMQNKDNNAVSIWDLKSGREVRSILGPEDNVGTAGLALSADGHQVAAGTPQRAVGLWDSLSGKLLASFTGLNYITSVAISPDSALLAAGDYMGGMKIWDIKAGKELAALQGDLHSPQSKLSFSPDGRLLAAAGSNSVVLWSTDKHDWSGSLAAGWVLALAFSPDSKRLATADLNTHTIQVWNIETSQSTISISNQTDIHALAFSPDGKWLASAGADHLVRLWDLATGTEVRNFPGHSGEATGVAFTPDGRWLISSGAEGSIRIWNPSTGQAVAILSSISGTEDWVAASPDGLFDGSPKATRLLVTWRIGGRVLAASQFYDTHSSPGLLAHLLAGNALPSAPQLAGFKMPPSVHLAPISAGGEVHDPQVNVTVQAIDEGGGISEVRLYQNGKLAGARLASPGQSVQYTFPVTLVPGQDNVLRVIALGTDRVESSPDEVTLHYQAPAPPKPALHVLVVGINNYSDHALHLDFAQPDAQALAHFFQSHGNLFSTVDIVSLLDQEATKANVQSAFDRLAQAAKPEDVALFYFAGHGVLVGREFYFLPYDMQKEADLEAAVQKYGVSASSIGEALQRIKAVKQVLILDACQSESALPTLAKATLGTRALENPEERAVRMLAHANGVYLIAASTAEQYAYEVPELGHGLFTYALLSGLGERDQPQAATPEGFVTVLSLINYVARSVPELTEKYHMGDPQTPVIFDAGTDIPLLASSIPR